MVRVMIVDDREPFRRVARAVIEATGEFVLAGEAATGEESVGLALALQPDLVLMDVNLPGIDGIEATRRILAGGRRVGVVLISTYEQEDYAARAAACGAAGYLPKSAFGPDTLAGAWAAATGG